MAQHKVTKTILSQRIRDLIAGTQKHPPNGPLTLDGKTFTAQSLTQLLQSLEDALAKVDTAKANWQDTLKQLGDARAQTVPVVGAYQSWLVATFGSAPATLADYGLFPRKKPAPLTTEQQAAAVAKRAATRAARHTLGSKQKKAITGTAPAPASTGATHVPAATPAAIAPKPAS